MEYFTMLHDEKFSSGVLWSYLQSWMARGITATSFLIIGWYLDWKEFGQFSVIAATLVFVELVCEQSFSQIIVQLPEVSTKSLSSIFGVAMFCSLLFAMGLFLSAELVANIFNDSDLVELLHLAAISPIFIGLTTVPMGLLRRELEFRVLARRTVLSSGISSAAGIALVIAGCGAWGLVLQIIIYYLISAGVLWRHCEWRPSTKISWEESDQLAKIAFWNATNKIADFAETRGLDLLVGALGGVQALGVFAFASKIAQTAFQTVSSPALEVVFAQIARQRIKSNIKNVVLNGLLIIGTLPTGLMLGLACIATPLLSVLYGDRWAEAALPLSILSLAYLARGLLYVIGSALMAISDLRITSSMTALRSSFTLLFCLFASNWTGGLLTGTAMGFLISALLVAPISLVVLSRETGARVSVFLSVPLKVVIAIMVAMGVIALGQLTHPDNIISIGIATLAGGVFLLTVTALNAKRILHSLEDQSKTDVLAQILQRIRHFAGWTLELRERLMPRWYEISSKTSSCLFTQYSSDKTPSEPIVENDTEIGFSKFVPDGRMSVARGLSSIRPRRIGVDFHVFDGKFQGSRSHLMGIYAELVKLLPQCEFFFFLEQTQALGRLEEFQKDNVNIVHMPHANPLVRLGWQLPKLRRKLHLDILHTQYIIPFFPATGNAVTIHDILFESFPQFFTPLFVLRSRLLIRWSARKADLLFTVSDYSRQELVKRYGISPEKIYVIHNAVNRQHFFAGEEGEEYVRARGLQKFGYFITVGRIEPRKNHATILRAYGSLPGRPIPLVIVGQRDFGYGDFEAVLNGLLPTHRVFLLSDVDDRELPALCRHAMAFIYPSLAEGFGMPPLESLASGVPVIASDTTAIPEVVDDAALLIDPTSHEALANAMSLVCSDPALRKALIRKGQVRAQLFNWEKSATLQAQAFEHYLTTHP